MTLISVSELADTLASEGSDLRVLDVRWSLPAPDGREAYEAGHIPSAAYVDLETELSDHSIPGRGRHPLPGGADLQATLRQWGVDAGDSVVVYDDWNRAGSARAWWVLRAAGISDVRILDGGLGAWVAAGQSLTQGGETATPGDVVVAPADLYSGALPTLTAEQVSSFEGVLVDARAPERYRGEVEPIDPVGGGFGTLDGYALEPVTTGLFESELHCDQEPGNSVPSRPASSRATRSLSSSTPVLGA